jgi:glycosyltransferase involved in cell wall biosynthesis
MIVGIDARFITHPQLGGFKTYSVNLIKALSEVDQTNRYIIYLDRTPCDGLLQVPENFTYKVVPATIPLIGMPFREQVTLRRQIAEDHPNIVHSLCNTAPVKISQKLVISLHDVIQVTTPQTLRPAKRLTGYRQSIMTAYSKWSILNSIVHAKKIITVSNYEKEQITRTLKISPHQICVTLIAPDPIYLPAPIKVKDLWRPEMHQKYGLPGRFILGIGYEPRKNIPLLIETFARLAPNQFDLGLVIVAAQEQSRQFFNQLAKKLNINDRVVVLGPLPPKELVILYNLAELFVFPSQRESFGLPPLEALACGTPTIAMNITSIPEILGDGALLMDGKDIHTWANAIENVINDECLRMNLVNRGLKQAAKMTWHRCARETVKVYQSIAEDR